MRSMVDSLVKQSKRTVSVFQITFVGLNKRNTKKKQTTEIFNDSKV